MRRRNPIPKYLSPAQVKAVIQCARPGRDQALLAVMYQCGLRRGEVKYLRRRDWQPGKSRQGMLTVWRLKKGDGLVPEEKPVWGRTRRLLEEYLETRDDEQDVLFRGLKGPLGPQAVYYVFKEAAARARFPKDLRHPHVLRHSIATHHANMGTDFGDIQNLLGHRDIGSTMRYAQVLTPRKEDMTMRSEGHFCFAKY